MDIYDVPVETADGTLTTLSEYRDDLLLIVNVASRCGLTPQYGELQELSTRYEGLSIVGFPCNQFKGQEPGTNEEIQAFCSATYGVDFPVLAKTEVNGAGRHPLYSVLTEAADAAGEAGDVQWNFEKFLVRDGRVVARVRPRESPATPEFAALVEEHLPR
ncbi:glutathione peroxidase [Rathayibacter sp. VKM Ac-2759]|uniref:glutathione peroxidase n=1 Tax=Rathayibacter sp. VKM Ac-2759 TaxID=2609252 RepID=UPI00131889D6|nr:glutathione peroxidase [Rathayibacter sp. VKM Ac-2759]QHC65783.1 glutathione peroxidase [Rathayibacter sp. VKM Ac-2759]